MKNPPFKSSNYAPKTRTNSTEAIRENPPPIGAEFLFLGARYRVTAVSLPLMDCDINIGYIVCTTTETEQTWVISFNDFELCATLTVSGS